MNVAPSAASAPAPPPTPAPAPTAPQPPPLPPKPPIPIRTAEQLQHQQQPTPPPLSDELLQSIAFNKSIININNDIPADTTTDSGRKAKGEAIKKLSKLVIAKTTAAIRALPQKERDYIS